MTDAEFNQLAVLLTKLADEHYEIMDKHGFHEDWNTGEKLALVHSEVSEWLEEVRDANEHAPIYFKAENIQKPEGEAPEAVDVLFRMLDILKHENKLRDFCYAIKLKLEYNRSRPFKHGRKF